MREWIVKENEAGQRLDKYLKWRLPNAPYSFFYKMARKKNLVLNGKKCTGHENLSPKDQIKLFVSEDTIALFSAKEKTSFDSYVKAFHSIKDAEVLKETENYVFVYKPSGVLTQKAKPEDVSLNDWLIGYLYETGKTDEEAFKTYHPSVLNRLDRNTSGIVFCAKTTKGSRIGSELIRNGNLRKYYHCIVDGECKLEGLLEGCLSKDSSKNKSDYITKDHFENIPGEQQKEYSAVSISVKPLEYKYGKTLMEVELHSGKSHQIRVMMAYYGFPIVGDVKYGDEKRKTNGQLLCAVRVGFPDKINFIDSKINVTENSVTENPVSENTPGNSPDYAELLGLTVFCNPPFSLEDFKV